MRATMLAAMFTGASVAAGPAAAQLRPLVAPPVSAEAARAGVEVYVLNEGPTALPATGPAELEAVALDGARLRLIPAQDDPQTVAPGGFARLRYRLAASYPVAVAVAPRPAAAAPAAGGETIARTSRGGSAAFIDRFSPYAPVYAAIGGGDDGAKLQVSFDLRLFGTSEGPRLDFAYTHTFFFATKLASVPLRAQGFSPEVFVDLPLDPTLRIGGGYRHDSNGGGVRDSIDSNRYYLRATKSVALGHGWALAVTPQAWGFFGTRGVAYDIDRYWGHTSLALAVGQRDGAKLAVTGRGTPGASKANVEGYLSYPFAGIDRRLPPLYLFGEAFAGYGETLRDYRSRSTAVRIGIALTR